MYGHVTYVIYETSLIGLGGRAFANGLGDLGSIPGLVIPKDFKKWYLIPPCLTLSDIKGKVEQSKERSSTLPLHLGVVAIEKGAFWLPSTTVANFLYRKIKKHLTQPGSLKYYKTFNSPKYLCLCVIRLLGKDI